MTAIYEKHGVKFLYPENWTLTEDVQNDRLAHISIEAPNGCLWTMGVFDESQSVDELIDQAVEGLHESYDDIEVSPTHHDFAGFPAEGVDAYFYYLDFMVMAQIRVIDKDHQKFLFHYQAESRDFEAQQDVFKAITTSVLSSV